jgi:hypothetical protein
VPATAIGHDEGVPAAEVFDSLPDDALFVYERTCENWIAGPYERTTTPTAPIKVEEFPEELLENAIRFEGRFVETEVLQPASLWRCESWEPGWLATDRTTVRPFAGREDELVEMREDIDTEELRFLPAADVDVDAERLFPRGSQRGSEKKPWWKLW